MNNNEISFELSSEQNIKLYKWNKKHKNVCPLFKKDGAIGGRLTFSFTPNGIGVVIKVRCFCGHELDLTDCENW